MVGLLCSSAGKESTCNAGDPGLGKSHGGEHGNPLWYSCLENPHGLSLMSYSPQGHRGSDTTGVTECSHTREEKSAGAGGI